MVVTFGDWRTGLSTCQLSLSSLWGRYIEYWPLWMGLRQVTCVWWQVKLKQTKNYAIPYGK